LTSRLDFTRPLGPDSAPTPAAFQDIYARGQPRGEIFVKLLLVQLDVCNMGVATQDWDVSGCHRRARAGDERAGAWATGRRHGRQ
jgi:hypothetical protein